MAMSRPIIESTMDYKERVDVRLEEFVHYFVKEFEAKLMAYNLILEGEVRKTGKLAETVAEKIGKGGGYITGTIVGSLIQMPAQGAKVGTEAGRTVGKVFGDVIGSQHHKSKVVGLLPVIENWCKDKASFRGKLMEAGFDIFQSFEMQFMRVETDIGPKNAMKRLATDAVKRALSYLRKDNNASISKSVILGDSKKVANFIYPGFEIIYKYLGKTKKWRTSYLYSKAGIVREISSATYIFRTKEKGERDAAEYGCRRLLACEDWTTEEKYYASRDITEIIREEFTEYRYILNNKHSEKKIKDMLDNLNAKDESLTEERIIGKITDIKSELNDLNHQIISDMKEIQNEFTKDLEDIRQPTVPQKLQEYFPLDITKYTYIPQTFQRHEHIKLDCLKADVFDIYAISNADIDKRSQHVFSEHDTMVDNLSRIVALDNEKDAETNFELLCKNHEERNIHWLEYNENGYFLWKRTYGNISKLRELVEQVNVTSYQPKNLDDIQDKIILVTGAPGIGKSTLLSHLQLQQEGDIGNLLNVYRINLTDYRHEIYKAQFSNLNQVNEFFKKIVPGLMLEGSALLFDGFDEMCPRYENKVISLLKFLKDKIEVQKICLSSRTNMRNVLENELGVFSYSLSPFSMEEQKSYLSHFWQTNLLHAIKLEKIKELSVKIRDSNDAEEINNFCKQVLDIIIRGNQDSIWRKIEELILDIIKDATLKSKNIIEILVIVEVHTASTVVKDMSSIISGEPEEIKISIQELAESYAAKLLVEFHQRVTDNEREFVGIPLQLRMLAEAFEDNFLIFFYKKQSDKKQGITENISVSLPDTFNLIVLYERFVKCKWGIFYRDKVKSDLKSPTVQEALDMDSYIKDIDDYGKLAIAMIFSENVICFNVHVDDEKRRKLLRVGIATQCGKKISFTNRTFAEYFAAVFIANALGKKQNKVVRKFLHEHILKNNNQVIRYFLDSLLTQKSVLNMAVLNKEVDKIKSLINSNRNIISECDTEGRTALHLASGYGYCTIVETLLNHEADVNCKDKLFGWSALTYADKGKHLEVAELLLQRKANVEDMLDVVRDIKNYSAEKKETTVLHIAAKNGLVKSIEQFIRVSKAHQKELFKPHMNSSETVELLPEFELVNAQDDQHFTPLHYAASNNNLDAVKTLLRENADINAQAKDSYFTPLHIAVQNGRLELVNILLDHGATILAAYVKLTPLIFRNTFLPDEPPPGQPKFGIVEHKIESSLFVLEHWCKNESNANLVRDDFDIFNVDKWASRKKYYAFGPDLVYPLHLAAMHDYEEVIEALCKRGNSSGHCRSPRKSPLCVAAEAGNLKAVKILIKYGAVVDFAVLNYALQNTDRVEMKKLFLSRNPHIE